MTRTKMFGLDDQPVLCFEDDHDFVDQMGLKERFRKTLYFGKTPAIDRPSLPLTELAVELCQDAAKRELGKVDTEVAASIGRQACISPCSMVLGLVYIERLKKKNPNYLQKVSSSDLFFISMMMASKFAYDEGVEEEVFNDEWAESANLDIDDVNSLEIDFLSAMDWGLFIGRKEFQSALLTIEKRIALGQGLDRNWFSYTDLWVLLQDPKYKHLWQEIKSELRQVFLACSLAYLAGLVTMVGSVVALSYASVGISMTAPILSSLYISTVGDSATPHPSVNVLPSIEDKLIIADRLSINSEVNVSLNPSLPTEIADSDLSFGATEHNEKHGHRLGEINSSDVNQENLENLPRKQRFNSGFRPFLAVMTLKNALMNFVSAVSGSDGQRGDNWLADAELSPFDCGSTTCLGTAAVKPTCFNLTIPTRKNTPLNPVSWKHGARTCCVQCRRILASQAQSHASYKSVCRTRLITSSSKFGSSEIWCCCQSATNINKSWKLQTDTFPDITENLGFHTRTLAPLVAVT